MADTKISALTALTGANVNTAADVLAIVDTDVATTKKILVDELAIAMRATQAEQEAGTSANTTVSPSVQHFHPSAAKAWGKVTHATTVDASYPSAGVSVNNSGTGVYVVTHGLTFSSSNYSVVVTITGAAAARYHSIASRTATTFTLNTLNSATAAANVDGFEYVVYGDL